MAPFWRKEKAVSDPVCGMDVLPSKAPASTPLKGRILYFCSAECFSRFKREPEKYGAAPGPQ